MFQYEWFDKNVYVPINDKKHVQFSNLFKSFPIKYVRLSLWAEHCLECAPPLCYKNCPNYVERFDKKCRNLIWGMNGLKNVQNAICPVDIKFREWGKLETQVFPAVLPLKNMLVLNQINKTVSQAVTAVSKNLAFISPYLRLNGALTHFRLKYLFHYKKKTPRLTPTFLCQLFSFENEPFNLCFEIVSKHNLLYRDSFLVKPSENIFKRSIDSPVQLNGEKILVRIYPENNISAHIVLNFCDFVLLEESEHKDAVPQLADKLKCIVWDLDNTVWNGILIETDENKLNLRKNVMKTMIELDKRGILQSICSKNDEEPALNLLAKLGISEYFLYPMINWNSKSTNMEKIAELLNIDINSFGFIDDSIFERNEVLSVFPQVRVYDEKIIDTLFDLPELNIEITKEAGNRRMMYKTEALRKDLKVSFNKESSNIDFLRSCEITINIFKPTDVDSIKRCYELLMRTNQLNLSAQKYSYDEFNQLIDNDKLYTFAVSCQDKFGTYGQVAFIQCEIQENALCVIEFAMSCRIAEKCVESAIITWLQKQFKEKLCDYILFKGVQTQRNTLLKNTLLKIGFTDKSQNGNIEMLIPYLHILDNNDVVKVI